MCDRGAISVSVCVCVYVWAPMCVRVSVCVRLSVFVTVCVCGRLCEHVSVCVRVYMSRVCGRRVRVGRRVYVSVCDVARVWASTGQLSWALALLFLLHTIMTVLTDGLLARFTRARVSRFNLDVMQGRES